LLELPGVARAEDDRGPFRGERLRDRAADAARRPGDERDLPGECERPVGHAFPSAASVASSDAGSLTCSIVASLAIFFTRPPSTWPGPTSTNVSTPSRVSSSTDSCQRTAPETCRTRPSR